MTDSFESFYNVTLVEKNDLLHRHVQVFRLALAQRRKLPREAFLLAMKWLYQQVGFNIVELAKYLSREPAVLTGWAEGKKYLDHVPEDELAIAYLNRTCDFVVRKLVPCSPEFQYEGREIIAGRWVLPLGFDGGMELRESFWEKLSLQDGDSVSYLRRGIAAAKSVNIVTLEDLLTNGRKQILSQEGVGKRAVDDLFKSLIHLGIVDLEQRRLPAP